MKYSQLFTKTQRELPAQEDAKNAELLLRGGFIRKELAGVYSYLPLGLRVLRKISQIVREEMDQAGCQEVLMPAIAKKESWEQTGRWETVDVLYKLEMANGKHVALSPTHEEVVTPMAQSFSRSYKDFPYCIYQIQNKFRNEPRAKSGILRGREFLMKDAYSFHTSQEDFDAYYENMKDVYKKVYDRLGLGDITHIVAASGGDFSQYSHEFQTLNEVGEDKVFYDTKQNIYYNQEIAPSQAPALESQEPLPSEDVKGENIIGVQALSEFLGIPEERTTKTLFYEMNEGVMIAAVIRGTYDVNEIKLKEVLGCKNLKLADKALVKKITGSEIGYAGLVNLPDSVRVVIDDSMQGVNNFECGSNKTHYHTKNVNFGRDIPEPDQFYDIKTAQKGDLNPETGEVYQVSNAIEVGNIFPLSKKFSEAFGFKATGEDGKPTPILMGCYGIGISRLMGTLVEVFHDDKGILWPKSVAPFQVYLAAISKNDAVYTEAEKLYKELQDAGIEVLYDDRREKKVGPGQKFSDHELLGIPVRIVMSEKTEEKGIVELVNRETGEAQEIQKSDILKHV